MSKDGAMSLEAMLAVFALDAEAANPSERLVLLAIGNFADEWGEAWPAHETVAGMTGLSAERVRHVVRALVKRGLIEREVQGSFDPRIRGDHIPNLYRLTFMRDVLATLGARRRGVAGDRGSLVTPKRDSRVRAVTTTNNEDASSRARAREAAAQVVLRCEACGKPGALCRCA